jgi:GT2 family glycosyltransferase
MEIKIAIKHDIRMTGTAAHNHDPLVSVVILNWNGRKFLERFLPSVMSTTYANKQIWVADNASTDDSVAFLTSHYPGIKILVNKTNEGFAQGYNSALQQVESDYYVLLNSDVEVSPNWIEPVIALLESDPAIAACQPKVLSFENKELFEYAGACGGWIDRFGYPFSRGRVFDDCEKDHGQYDEAQPCFWATGTALFVRASVYHEIGGLDAYFFAHQEEIDLCWRMQLAGYKVFVQPASVIYHVGGGTLPKSNSRKTFLNFRNNLIMLAKNLPVTEALWKIPFRFLLDAITAFRALFSGKGGDFMAILKAHLFFFKWLCFHRSRSVFPKIKSGTPAGWYRGSVAWNYFVLKKRTFDKIVGNK